MLETTTLPLLRLAIEELDAGLQSLPAFEPKVDTDAIQSVLMEVARRMQDNYPYPHPMYAGQMLKPPHPVARLAYALSLFINPNNHALDGGRASSEMEKEAVANIAEMLGFSTHLGHLCGGGTMANLEALWVSGLLHPESLVVASEQAHYTHSRISEVLKIPFAKVGVDESGRMDISELRKLLAEKKVGTVVATTGTTAIGSVDPLPEILKLKEEHGFRLHVDAAYGGYFKLADNLDKPARAAFDLIGEADSAVIDPHKHGLQPYGCGCVIFKDPAVGALYKHDSPYTYFSSDELHLGEISLECSRPGSAAVALWATQRLLPMTAEGEFAADLSRSRRAALAMYERLKGDSRFIAPLVPELDIVVYAIAAGSASESSRAARQVFQVAAENGLHLAVANLPRKLLESAIPGDLNFQWDQENIACLRSCLMKPEHLDWLDDIWRVLSASVEAVSVKS